MSGGSAAHASTLRDYVRVVQRRKWIILQAVVLVPLAAILFSLHQQKLYQSSAQVLLSSQNLAAQLTGTQSTGINLQPDRIAQTQASVARVPEVAKRVLALVRGTGLTVETFLASSSVTTSPNSDILGFAVTNHDPRVAQRLADAYAQQYTVFRRALDTASIQRALDSARGRIKELAQGGGRRSSLYASLVEREQTLATMEALQTANASVVKRADDFVQVQPKPKRNAILGLVLGIVLGLGLAFLWEALDTRVRQAEEIGEKLGGLPLLARIPVPNKRIRAQQKLVMLEEPNGVQSEAFRMLRTNLEFVALDRDVKTIMVTSAVEQEGKSTTIANLAVALARSGQRVVLVDLDLRRPFVDRFFGIRGPGVTQVALGHASLDEALVQIPIVEPGRPVPSANGNGGRTNGKSRGAVLRGMLEVLPSGPIPPDPGEFVGTHALQEILSELRERADIVLVDAPPALHVGDAMRLSTRVDAILLVTRMKVVRRQMLHELARQVATVPTPVLGFVVTGAQEEEGYASGYAYARPYEQDPLEHAVRQA